MDAARMTPERVMISAALVLTAIVFLPAAADPVNVVKLTLLLLAAVGAVALVASRAVRSRVVLLPSLRTAGPALMLLLAFAISAVAAPVANAPLLGTYGRNSGFLAYGAAIVLFLVAVCAFDRRNLHVLHGGVVAAGLFTSVYGLFQLAGIDAIAWANPFNPVIAALGNPDFASAYMGICVPVAAGIALLPRLPRTWRITAGLTAALCLVTALASSAIQGPIAAAGGLGLLALSWTLNQAEGRRRAGLVALAAVFAIGAAVLTLGVLGHGPFAGFFNGISYRARTWYWTAALTMFAHHPVFGIGLDLYGGYWWRERPVESIQQLGGGHFSDAAHSVPLQMLAQGGVVLGIAYVVFVGYVGVRLVRGLQRLRGDERLLLGGVGGGWLAYQVQSLVSIDQVPLIVAHFVLAAATVVAADAVRFRELRLRGAPALPTRPGRRGRGPGRSVQTRRGLNGADYAWLSGVGLLAAVLAWQSLLPVRADVAARQGGTALARGNGNAALAAYDRATDLTPGVGTYWSRKFDLLTAANQPKRAVTAALTAARHDPFSLTVVRTAATSADSAQRTAEARRLWARAVYLDPNNPETLSQATAFELRNAGATTALGWLRPAVARQARSAVLWTTLGDASAAAGSTAAARTAYERALALEPGQAAATAGLGALGGR